MSPPLVKLTLFVVIENYLHIYVLLHNDEGFLS
jgi:hypothetical protein